MGVVGVGKSTLREQLRSCLPSASVYEEWPQTMAKEVLNARCSMSSCSAEDIQEWIFSQLADKNRLIANDPAELQIVDRSPLDTFAFYHPQEWKFRGQQMMDVLRMKDALPLVPGQLLFLTGSPKVIHERMDAARSYSVNAIAQQQSAFEILADWLADNFDYTLPRVDTRGRTPKEIAQQALGTIDADGSGHYVPLDTQSVVEALAGGQR